MGRVQRSRGRKNHNQDIMYEKNILLSIKGKKGGSGKRLVQDTQRGKTNNFTKALKHMKFTHNKRNASQKGK